MNDLRIKKKIAKLELAYEQMSKEWLYLDNLLKLVGFPCGISSARQVALELLENESEPSKE